MYEKLKIGREVTIVTNVGEVFQGRVKCRFGIGTEANFSPNTEKIILENKFGHNLEILLSAIKEVK